jgi:periplasmic protein TonB
MSARALPWLADEDTRDLARWIVAAAAVLAIHAALIAFYLLSYQPTEVVGDDAPLISIDIVAPEIDQVEQAKVEKPTPPQPQTSTDSVIPEEKPPEKVEPTAPAPRTTVHTVASAPRIDPSWQSLLIRRLQHYKQYPSTARAHNEQGVVMLAFSVDRDGHVLARHIVSSSGYSALDAEVLALIDRAQPLPAFPPSMHEGRLDLTVPIRFSLR